jgi:plastocyanin
MKQILVILAVIVIAGLAYFWWQGGATTDGTMENDNSTAQENATEGNNSDSMLDADVNVDVSVGDSKVFTLTGKPYEFSKDEIHVNKGDTVTIIFESTEGLHDFVVDEFDAATEQVTPGVATSVTFVADKAGEFEFYCSVGNHRAQGMSGTLVVGE